MVTTTTIGFGDMSLNWNRSTAVVVEATFISVGLVLIALPIGLLADLFGEQVTAAEEAVGGVVDDAQAAVRTAARHVSSVQPVGAAQDA
jgi:hypothetical protein